MVKVQKALKISNDVYDDIDIRTKKEDFNFSEWVEMSYIKEFMTESSIKNQMEFHEKQKCILLKKLDKLKMQRESKLKLLKKRCNELYQKNINLSKEILKKNPEKINARLRAFNHDCNTNFTKTEFIEYLEL